MSFYDALQMDPSILKSKISKCETTKEKLYYWTAIAVRSVLIVSFAVIFITAFSNLLGQENTPFAVALFCILLGIRFVNFQYCIGDSLFTFAAALLILVFAPSLATAVPKLSIIVHFVCFFMPLYITSQRPELGNGGLYSFAYVYLSGNAVFGDVLIKRAVMALIGYVICGVILYRKHKHMHSDTRFHSYVLNFDLNNMVHLWQFRMAVGVSIILYMGQLFGVERFMWMGFACASLLSEYPYSHSVKNKFCQRIIGVIVGSGLFFIIYKITPESFHSMLGPIGGLCLGFCTDYRYKTAINCFGALMIASGIYGIEHAAVLRVVNTILGVVFAMVFAYVFHKIIGERFNGDNNKELKFDI